MTQEAIPVRVLLVSGSSAATGLISQQMQFFASTVHICPNAESATQRLCCAQFEGVVVDFDLGKQAIQLLEKLRHLPSHRHAILYAVINDPVQANDAFRAHANFVLSRPLSRPAVFRTLRAAYPMMFQERRRRYRHPVDMRIFVRPHNAAEFWANSINISETGMALFSKVPLSVGDRLHLEVKLPGVSDLLRITGEVSWNANERAGLRFVDVAPKVAQRLQCWLSDRMSALVAQ